MNFLFMICSEYHDNYSDIATVVAKDFDEVFKIIEEEYEYSMQGYGCARELHGPVHPDVASCYVKHVNEPYHQPTLGDIFSCITQ
jgi:hypothetical protein